MNIRISPFAEKDLQESIGFYNDQKADLGDEFAETLNRTFNRILGNPNQFPFDYKNIKKARMDRFPFIVYFVLEESACYILGIFHSSRNPDIMNYRSKVI